MQYLMNAYRPPLISSDFFGTNRSKSFGLYVVVPEGYQYALESFGVYRSVLFSFRHLIPVLTPRLQRHAGRWNSFPQTVCRPDNIHALFEVGIA
jgi:hypothetical protein